MNRLEDFTPVFFDNDFKPLAGGTIEVLADDNTKRLALFAGPDSGDNEVANPVGLNSSGRSDTPVYFKESSAIIVLKDRAGVKVKSFRYSVSSSIRGSIDIEGNINAGIDVIAKQDVIAGRNVIAENVRARDIYAPSITANKVKAREIEAADSVIVGRDIILSEAYIQSVNVNARFLSAEELLTETIFAGSGNLRVGSDLTTDGDLTINGKVKIADASMAVAPFTTDKDDLNLPIGTYILANAEIFIERNSQAPIAVNYLGYNGSAVDSGFYEIMTAGYENQGIRYLQGTWLCSGGFIIARGSTNAYVYLCRRVS